MGVCFKYFLLVPDKDFQKPLIIPMFGLGLSSQKPQLQTLNDIDDRMPVLERPISLGVAGNEGNLSLSLGEARDVYEL